MKMALNMKLGKNQSSKLLATTLPHTHSAETLKNKMSLLYRAHSCYPGSFNLSATVAFQRSFTEKEVDVRANFKALYEIHICQK